MAASVMTGVIVAMMVFLAGVIAGSWLACRNARKSVSCPCTEVEQEEPEASRVERQMRELIVEAIILWLQQEPEIWYTSRFRRWYVRLERFERYQVLYAYREIQREREEILV